MLKQYIYSASERSEGDTYRGNTIKNRGCLFIYWRASEASETVLGVDNAKSGICYIYCTYGLYVCPLNARAGNVFSSKNTAF